jgi:DNA modification methylase
MGRHYLGFEIVPEYYEFAKQRLNRPPGSEKKE